MKRADCEKIVGSEIQGYTIKELIAFGGQGAGYRMENAAGEVAFGKLVYEHPTIDVSKQRDALERESNLLTKLDHPGVPKTMGVYQLDELNFSIREYKDGRSLAQVLEDSEVEAAGKISEAQAVDVMYKTLDILAYLHDSNNHGHNEPVVHRDIKPGNIIVDSEGNIMLTDFGIAKTIDRKTMTSAGTELYMPFEQLMNTGSPASDIYSLGVTIVEAITGEHPGAYFEFMNEPLDLAGTDVHEDLQPILEKMVQFKDGDRFQSVDAVIAALDRTEYSRNQETRALAIREQEAALAKAEEPTAGQMIYQFGKTALASVGPSALYGMLPRHVQNKIARRFFSEEEADSWCVSSGLTEMGVGALVSLINPYFGVPLVVDGAVRAWRKRGPLPLEFVTNKTMKWLGWDTPSIL